MKDILLAKTRFPTFEPSLVLGITLVFVAGTFCRGLAWALSSNPATVSDMMLELSFGREQLGVLLATGAIAYIVALASGRHLAVWAAHGFLFAVHFGAGYTILESVISYGSGVQHLIFVTLNLVWHGAVMFKMRPLPPPSLGT